VKWQQRTSSCAFWSESGGATVFSLANVAPTVELDPLELVRTIAAARLMMPEPMIRLWAGRSQMTDERQALCLLASVSSLFLGDQLLTTPDPYGHHDQHQQLLDGSTRNRSRSTETPLS
jgi:biotin synthase-like enzyme